MEFRCSPIPLSEWDGETLAVGIFQGDDGESRQLLQARFGEGLISLLEHRKFKGKPGETLSLSLLDRSPAQLIVVGLGESAHFDGQGLRSAVAAIARAAAAGRATELGIALPSAELEPAMAARLMAEAVRLTLYTDPRFKSEPEPRHLPQTVTLLGLPEAAAAGLAGLEATCAGVELARQLVAAPPNVVTPQALADTAATIAREFGLELKVLERSDCEALGMGAYLGVAQGSCLPPKFIHLTYRPADGASRRLVLIGKGVTFDSGGYNLKTAGSQIEMMKYDMGGSAAVLGAARAIAELRPADVEVHVLVAACENMISGNAIHPGDILTASNGKTIEINNTDAEGRLTLADALVYASRLEPDAVVDLATLTGACVIALGEEIAGLWSPSDELAAALLDAGRQGGEQFWRMPLQASYKEGLKSPVADLKNTGPRPGGSITAALFLQDFVDPATAWAHLDIAGTVWSDKGRGLDPAGATGFGVRTLVNWVSQGGRA
ncbi:MULTISPECIES: leucyl aminopeptidase [unclassified Synechococcus]|uniref:leucyl aminopeptidase n=1 Tax=unclassified Synechococcus TaxID=2626047 RepID=UPI0021A7B143|nr:MULTISPECIES: leucyl aminopeptidase [unclassified Synechococcus]MCT0212253.1 leucyl aminopeptidase [Synechococcus sp. CS-1326]MCT0234334.1 leucyl aminopeptidase [Synechococcus sp. CS-1327]